MLINHPNLCLLAVMFLAGLAGGSLAHLLGDGEPYDALSTEWKAWLTAVTAGEIASFMVPLFLNTISSSLVDSIIGTRETPGSLSKLFIFAGFCLAAAVSSKAFITTLSAKVLREVRATRKEVRQVKSEVEPIIEKETEKEPSEPRALSASVADSIHLGDDERRVLKALADGKFTLRTRTGVATQTGIKKEVVDKMVEDLKAAGLVNSVQILRKGQPKTRWYITPEGRSALGSLG